MDRAFSFVSSSCLFQEYKYIRDRKQLGAGYIWEDDIPNRCLNIPAGGLWVVSDRLWNCPGVRGWLLGRSNGSMGSLRHFDVESHSIATSMHGMMHPQCPGPLPKFSDTNRRCMKPTAPTMPGELKMRPGSRNGSFDSRRNLVQPLDIDVGHFGSKNGFPPNGQVDVGKGDLFCLERWSQISFQSSQL